VAGVVESKSLSEASTPTHTDSIVVATSRAQERTTFQRLVVCLAGGAYGRREDFESVFELLVVSPVAAMSDDVAVRAQASAMTPCWLQ